MPGINTYYQESVQSLENNRSIFKEVNISFSVVIWENIVGGGRGKIQVNDWPGMPNFTLCFQILRRGTASCSPSMQVTIRTVLFSVSNLIYVCCFFLVFNWQESQRKHSVVLPKISKPDVANLSLDQMEVIFRKKVRSRGSRSVFYPVHGKPPMQQGRLVCWPGPTLLNGRTNKWETLFWWPFTELGEQLAVRATLPF